MYTLLIHNIYFFNIPFQVKQINSDILVISQNINGQDKIINTAQ